MSEKILVIQTAFIGDAVLTLPLLQKIKEKYPGSSLDVLCTPITFEIFNSSDVVNNAIVLDKKAEHKSLFSLLKFAKILKKNNYSRIYSPHRSTRTSLLVLQLGVKESYGFDTSSLKHVYKNLVNYNPDHHEVQRNLDLLADFSENKWKIIPQINIPTSIKNKVNLFLDKFSGEESYAAIAPGSVWNTKKYPKEYYKEVLKYLETKFDLIFIIGGKEDKNICDEIADFSPRSMSVAGEFSIIESIEFLKRMKLLLTNDSAPTHFGMCADIPVLTVYCSTTPEFGFYPYNNKSSFISFDGLSCKPCGIHGFDSCPLKHFDCGVRLTPDLVIKKIKEMMNETNL